MQLIKFKCQITELHQSNYDQTAIYINKSTIFMLWCSAEIFTLKGYTAVE